MHSLPCSFSQFIQLIANCFKLHYSDVYTIFNPIKSKLTFDPSSSEETTWEEYHNVFFRYSSKINVNTQILFHGNNCWTCNYSCWKWIELRFYHFQSSIFIQNIEKKSIYMKMIRIFLSFQVLLSNCKSFDIFNEINKKPTNN